MHSFKMSESLVKHKTDSFEVNPGIDLISTGFCAETFDKNMSHTKIVPFLIS